MTFSSTTYFVGVLLVLLQILAALPWVLVSFFSRDALDSWKRRPFSADVLPAYGIILALLLLGPVLFPYFVREGSSLEVWGQVYAASLQVQLLLDLFIVAFVLLLLLWPKGGSIALAAFREGLRQPMFWLLFGVAFLAMSISPLIPYFTFGEDHLVVKDLGYDTIMLVAAVFGALAASMSISEEIEGRTAVTLMSKPVSRRQFLIGKFIGITLAGGVLFALLGTYFEGVVRFKHWWDKMDPEATPVWLVDTLQHWSLPGVATDFLRGVGLWTHLTLDTWPGLVLGFAQVMVLISIAVTLATRVPMVVNLVVVVVLFFLAHLTPVLVAIGYQAQASDPGTVSQILAFMAQLLDTLLPDLDLFRLDPSLLNETPLAAGAFTRFLGSVSLYGLLYTSIVLLFGLILFEDRDLA